MCYMCLTVGMLTGIISDDMNYVLVGLPDHSEDGTGKAPDWP